MAQYNNAQNSVDYNTPVTLSGAANVTAVLADYIIGVDDTAAPRSVTLPTASTTGAAANSGKIYLVKDQSGLASVNNITIAPAAGTIDGAASVILDANYGEAAFYSDGSAWYQLNLGIPIPVPVAKGGTSATSLTDGGILLGSGTAAVTVTAQPVNGQLLVGSTGLDPVLATLTAGSGIGIVNAAGSITISGGAVVWSAQAAGTALLPNEGFISTNAAAQNFSLPATAVIGEVFELAQNGAGLVTITQAALQSIRFGNAISTVGAGGSVTSSSIGDAIKLVCVVANTGYQVVTGSVGNWNIV